MHSLYNMGIGVYGLAIRMASLFYPKANDWIAGRRNLLEEVRPADIWFHCASLGEFEQGRPVIEQIRQEQPHKKILLTFFSPSGYEVRKSYPLVDQVCYLPLDSPYNAHAFLQKVNPEIAVFVKYEFWANYLLELHKQGIRTYLVSAIFREDQHFFKWYGAWFRKVLTGITHFFVQDQNSQQLLQSIGISQSSVSGDSRFDRVLANTQTASPIPLIEQFKGDAPLIVCGSSWPKDEALLLSISKEFPEAKWVFAPHELKHCNGLAQQSQGLLYSQANQHNIGQHKVLIIDSMGQLSKLYQYANVAYVGGGFGAGIHNILEAAAFGCPVVFGLKHQKFKEAQDLINLGGAQSIRNSEELTMALDHFLKTDKSTAISNYCQQQAGASTLIVQQVLQKS